MLLGQSNTIFEAELILKLMTPLAIDRDNGPL